MKKSLVYLMFFLLLAAPATAEIVAQTPQEEYIHRYAAENGQDIYYVSREDEWANVLKEDVNFDGHDDLVFPVTLGASNGFFEFWLWEDGQYVLAGRNALFDSGLPNYRLHPEQGLVSTWQHNGSAGLMHEAHIFRWDGTNLKLVRYAIAENQKTAIFEGDLFITIENSGLVQVRVFECEYGEFEREDKVIFDQTVSRREGLDERALLDAENAALWQGLK